MDLDKKYYDFPSLWNAIPPSHPGGALEEIVQEEAAIIRPLTLVGFFYLGDSCHLLVFIHPTLRYPSSSFSARWQTVHNISWPLDQIPLDAEASRQG